MALSSFTGALVSLIMFLNHEMLTTIFSWLLGSFSGKHWNEIVMAGPVILCSGALLWLLSRPLDLLSFGDETAQTLGLSIAKFRMLILVAATFCTAACVAVSGVIGFLGLMAPHMTRILSGPRHGLLIPGSCLLGATLMVIADTLDLLQTLMHQSLVLSIKVAAPLLAISALISISMGYLGHTVPQINVLVIGFPIRAMISLIVLVFTLSGAADIVVESIPSAIDQLSRSTVL